ncbi:MAG: hypothetical protein AB7T49_13770 [Oligoflexales bacterium]
MRHNNWPAKVACLAILLFANCSQPHSSELASSPQSRRLLGLPIEYQAATVSEKDLKRIKDSIRERRLFGWSVVAKVLSSISVDQKWQVPAWTSWYGRDDFRRIFDKLFFDLGKEGRTTLRPFQLAQIEEGERWNTNAISEVWSEADYQSWRSSIENAGQVRGLSGLQRVYFDRPVLQHVARNYPLIHKCRQHASLANRSECFDAEFPSNAAIVKTAWLRDDSQSSLPVYATDARGMERNFEAQRWVEEPTTLRPGDDNIFIAQPSNNSPGHNKYWMPAMHIMVKDLPDWAWITIWWSDQPDGDFGEDRPDFIRRLGGPWSNYKMCIAVDYSDLADVAEIEADYPTLAASLTVVKNHTAPYSWCSNPYIERGSKNHQTNCIGCHQHGGTSVRPDDVLKDEHNFPNGGRSRSRDTFPADYLWSLGVGEVGFANFIEDTIKDYKNHDNRLE